LYLKLREEKKKTPGGGFEKVKKPGIRGQNKKKKCKGNGQNKGGHANMVETERVRGCPEKKAKKNSWFKSGLATLGAKSA